MKVICPNCNSNIFNQDINVSSDVAYCQECTNIFKLSTILNQNETTNINNTINLNKNNSFVDLNKPPNGISIKKNNNSFELSCTTRSPIAFFLVPFMLVWSGGSLGGIYGTQIASGQFNLGTSLFGIPFIIGSVIFWSIAIMAMIGRISIKVEDNEGVIFTGVGSTGLQKFFKVDEISYIKENENINRNTRVGSIIFEGKKRIVFGSGLSEERRYYIIQALSSLMNKPIKNLIIPFFIFISLTFSSFAEIVYPEYTGENVVDLSGKFDNRYADSLKSELSQSQTEIRIVFLKTDDNVNLSFYAPKLFEKWKMKPDSVLVVIDPYLNKTGYGLGKKVLEDMKKRQVGKDKKNNQKQDDLIVDYDNLASAIFEKFSPDQLKEDDEERTNFNENISSDMNKDKNKKKKKKKKKDGINPLYILLPLLVIGGIGYTGWYFYMKKKHLKEIMETRANHLFDLNIQKQEILSSIKDLQIDIEKMNLYNDFDEEIRKNIYSLNMAIEKAEVFIDKIEFQVEEIELDDFDSIIEIGKKALVVKEELFKEHMESLDLRMNSQTVISRNNERISQLKYDIDNSRQAIENIKTTYNFLGFSDEKIKKCESGIRKVNKLFSNDEPLEAIKTISQTNQIISKIKKDAELIPTLYKQLREIMPTLIERTTEQYILDPELKDKTKKEINNLKSAALISLSNGEFENSEKIVKDIFAKINDIRNSSNTANKKK
ncbi:MAG: hypothetical protein U0354_19420 [Candidatus Sericytochromatia bacterium]